MLGDFTPILGDFTLILGDFMPILEDFTPILGALQGGGNLLRISAN